jgi:thioester reductase-like protein
MTDEIEVFPGDLVMPGLGLDGDLRQDLRTRVDELFHLAALTHFTSTRAALFDTNVAGTERILALAWDLHRHGQLSRFCYFSTAFVAGSQHSWHAPEDALCGHPAWSNAYEESKYAAEVQVREAIAAGLPAIIFRPSIVVGETDTGETSTFNGVYPFFRLVLRARACPGKLTDTLPLVPVDFVSRAAWAISRKPSSAGHTYHLVSKNPPTLESLLRVRREEFPHLGPLQLFPPDDPDAAEKHGLVAAMPYFNYLIHDLTFETTNTEQALAGTEVEMPDTGPEFVRRLVRYARIAGYL